MKFLLKASLLLVSICIIVTKALPDDGCWHACPKKYDPICGSENDDKNATHVFGNECIMDVHNDCFETVYKKVDMTNCNEIEDTEVLPNTDDFYFNH